MTLTVKTWCEALESGKYKQAEGQLRRSHEGNVCHCCLGVACDLSGQGDWQGDAFFPLDDHGEDFALPRIVRHAINLTTSTGDFEFDNLPPELQEEICGVVSANGRNVEIDGPPADLAGLNDYGVPFPLIAKVIRARPKGLFREDAP